MNKISYRRLLIYFILSLLIFSIDRITKIYVLNIAENTGSVDIFVNNFLNIILVWNTGIGFGLFSFDQNIIYNLITLLIITINLVILYFGLNYNNYKSFFFFIILGGSLGNLFDRLYYSAVPDFIDLNYNNFHWFVFNVADIFISVGIVCLIFVELFFNKSNVKDEK